MATIQNEPVLKTVTLIRRPLTLAQAAEVLQTSKRIVQDAIEGGHLPAFKVGKRWRVWSDQLEAFGRSGQPAATRGYETATRFNA